MPTLQPIINHSIHEPRISDLSEHATTTHHNQIKPPSQKVFVCKVLRRWAKRALFGLCQTCPDHYPFE
uniref:Uncharacterized protein n=1 Tax=Panagrellus redivivus TaxID=6233 RepID=A0A7E4VB28_PANRE